MFSLIVQNLISPAVLFFVLGSFAGLLKSDLSVPESLGRYLGIYLMMSIGFKGGVSISQIDNFTNTIIYVIIASIILSFLFPFLGYYILRKTSNLDSPTSAALSAHYGSVSIVTFAAAVNFLYIANVPYSGHMVSILALMEAPAILSGLYIAHRFCPETNKHEKEEMILAREIFTNGAVLLILGSLIIGMITGKEGLDKLSGFLISPFQGVLCLFLLDMGLIVTRNIHSLKNISKSVIMFGFYMPLICACIAALIAKIIGIKTGDVFLLIVLSASSSYIAVPAAMRLALPEANPSVYLPISLGITFPLNIMFGIPVYFYLANF
jgi:uncharacterized protein